MPFTTRMRDSGSGLIQCHGETRSEGGAAKSSSQGTEKFLKSMLRIPLVFLAAPLAMFVTTTSTSTALNSFLIIVLIMTQNRALLGPCANKCRTHEHGS